MRREEREVGRKKESRKGEGRGGGGGGGKRETSAQHMQRSRTCAAAMRGQ